MMGCMFFYFETGGGIRGRLAEQAHASREALAVRR
jgi:hypothetical protein